MGESAKKEQLKDILESFDTAMLVTHHGEDEHDAGREHEVRRRQQPADPPGPEPGQPELVRAAGQVERRAQRLRGSGAGEHRREIEHRQGDARKRTHFPNSTS